MKLHSIRIKAFQKFNEELHINELSDGINLFSGPNEVGKSTLARAIRTAFFERHRTKTLDHLQPWEAPSGSPEIHLEFDWRGQRWVVLKRFGKACCCDVHIAEQHYSSEEAEHQLAQLLGYEFPGKGASQAKHWGIPGLLWVEQGAIHDVHRAVEHASSHLQAALSAGLEDTLDTVSGGGDALIAKFEKARAAYLTTTGRPTGELKRVQEALQVAIETRDQLEQKRADYSHQVDRLSQLQAEKCVAERDRPWALWQQRATEAKAVLDRVTALRTQQQHTEEALTRCRTEQQWCHNSLRELAKQADLMPQRESDCHLAQENVQQCRRHCAALPKRLECAQTHYQSVIGVLNAVRQSARRQQLVRDVAQFAEETQRLKARCDDAQRLQMQVQQLEGQVSSQAIDRKLLSELQKCSQSLAELAIQKKAVATQLSYVLEPEQQLTLNDTPLRGDGTLELLEPAQLQIPGIGRVQITPGGQGVADLARRQMRLEDEQATLLQQLGAATVTEAEQRAHDVDALQRQSEQKRAQLQGLAAEGIEALVAAQQRAVQQHAQYSAELAQCPPLQTELVDVSQAEAAVRHAEADLRTVEAEHIDAQQAYELAKQRLETAQSERQRLHSELNAPERQQRELELKQHLTQLLDQEQTLRQEHTARQSVIDDAQPEMLQQDWERYRASAQSAHEAAQTRDATIRELSIRLEEQGAQGLEEQGNAAHGEVEALQRHHDALDRRARALNLLVELLKAQRQNMTRRLQAPLKRHLDRYVRWLFPQGELGLDDALKPVTLCRQNQRQVEKSALEALSFGAREQMGLISRFAYADMLREAGRPTLLILDDILVHSDQPRLEVMKRILYDAAQRHQILLLTCHPERWCDLGVRARDLMSGG